jgi:hypothetical protein
MTDLIENIRKRVAMARRLAAMSHQPDIREELLRMAESGEQDLKRLEAEGSARCDED